MSDDKAAVLDTFRRWGYLQADLDWLGRLAPAEHAELDATGGDAAERARGFYCGTLAAEFMHIPDPERRRWVADAMESEPAGFDREEVLEQLLRATIFEQMLQSRYIGNKRFSIEGIEALIPLLTQMIGRAAQDGVEEVVLAMSHRGRLNVMGQVVGRDGKELFAGFEDVDPRSIFGAGDVKYHLGATGTLTTRDGGEVAVRLVSNPSHLEAVNPVAIGRVRAKQTRRGDRRGQFVVPIIMHGDAAFAGQGVAAETLNLAEIDGFKVGGTIQLIVNNLLGFTTDPKDLHSSRFSSDVAKRLSIPIFHVNALDPAAVVRAGRMAMAYRQKFSSDVVVDLIGFRRHGHSEVDDPTITQPQLYRKISERAPLWESWAETIGASKETTEELYQRVRDEYSAASEEAAKLDTIPRIYSLPSYWDEFEGREWRSEHEVDTGIDVERIERLANRLTSVPDGFEMHPKVGKLLEQRAEMGRGERSFDFGMAEAVAIASLVEEGHPVRFSGQDTRRGTFNHRHAVWIDHQTGATHTPFDAISDDQASFEIYNSILSEAAVLGFEYGFSRDYPEALVAWEAQFGDFANGAQIIFDQFVTAGEDKWGLLSGLVVLLPHGFEGQGPEHSSARMERFLQLAAEDAIQIAQPSTACQYFHLLRRQTLRSWRKPLIVFTPKSGLRSRDAAAERSELARPRFWTVIPERNVDSARRILICTGKIGHELRSERKRREDRSTAILSVEQLYPFPEAELRAELDRFPDVREIVWVQEEPANMGALFFVQPRIERLTRGRHLRTVKRSRSASPATGSAKAHKIEQETLVSLAFG